MAYHGTAWACTYIANDAWPSSLNVPSPAVWIIPTSRLYLIASRGLHLASAKCRSMTCSGKRLRVEGGSGDRTPLSVDTVRQRVARRRAPLVAQGCSCHACRCIPGGAPKADGQGPAFRVLPGGHDKVKHTVVSGRGATRLRIYV